MNNAAFSRLLATNDKALIQELTKKKSNRPDRKGGKGGKKGGKSSRGGDDSDDDRPQGKGKGKGNGKGKGKGIAPKGGEDNQKEVQRDRAKERREGMAEYAHIAAEFENQAEVTLEDSKYLGGDMDHTHLVKGLDFSLLAKVRTELSKQKRVEEIHEQRQQKKNKKRTFETVLAKSVWRAVVDTLHPHHVDFSKRMQNMGKAISLGQRIRGAPSIFLPGRMAFEFDTSLEQGQQDIPKIVYMAKEDAPAVDHSKKVAATLPDTVVRVREAFQKAVEERKKRKHDKTTSGGSAGSYVVAEKISAPKHKAKDLDDDIFGDAGSYAETRKEIAKAAAAKAAKAAKTSKATETQRSAYLDDAGDEKYRKAPEGQIDPNDMVVEEKEGDVVGTAEDAAKPAFEAAERFQGPRAGWVFKLGTQGLGYYREKEVSTSAASLAAPADSKKSLRSARAAVRSDAPADDDAYGECFPDSSLGGARMTTLEEDSDEEEGKKKKKKGEKEDQTKMDSSYAQKQKGVPIDPKKKKMNEAQQWQKIEHMIKNNKQKSLGELEASGRSRKDPPLPRELTSTPAYF